MTSPARRRPGAHMHPSPEPVAVFLLPSPAAGHAFSCLDWLDAGEQERAASFNRAADANTYVSAHALLRASLSRVANAHGVAIAPGMWRFDVAPRGKPYLAAGSSPLDLRFSLSHCEGLVAAAVSVGREVGIDVERESRRVPAALRIARLRLSPGDHSALEAITDPAQRQRRFMALWTALEAVAKGTGLGLAMRRDTRRASAGGPGGDLEMPPDERRTQWHIARWRLGDHLIALAQAALTTAAPAICRIVAWDEPAKAFVDSADRRRLEAVD